VLAAHECLVLFKEIDGLNIKCYCTYHNMGSNPSFYVDTLQNKTAFYPATKEQRDLLFKKMHEAGYEWDADKLELKKIEHSPAWSEENESYLNTTIAYLKDAKEFKKTAENCINWLKSLKDRVGCEADCTTTKEWNEEDENWFKEIELMCLNFSNRTGYREKFFTWLKSLKERYTWKPSEEQLKSLQEVIDEGHFTSYPNALETLYEQLKQL